MEDFLLRLLEMSLAGSIAAVIAMLARLVLKRAQRDGSQLQARPFAAVEKDPLRAVSGRGAGHIPLCDQDHGSDHPDRFGRRQFNGRKLRLALPLSCRCAAGLHCLRGQAQCAHCRAADPRKTAQIGQTHAGCSHCDRYVHPADHICRHYLPWQPSLQHHRVCRAGGVHAALLHGI